MINPLHQELEPFNWVLAWQDVMSVNQASRLHTRLAWQCHVYVCTVLPGWSRSGPTMGRRCCRDDGEGREHCVQGTTQGILPALFTRLLPCLIPPADGLPVRAVLLPQVARRAAPLAGQQPQLRRSDALVRRGRCRAAAQLAAPMAALPLPQPQPWGAAPLLRVAAIAQRVTCTVWYHVQVPGLEVAVPAGPAGP